MIFPPVDWIALIGCFVGLAGLIGLGEWLRRCGWAAAGTRGLVHSAVGLFVAGTPLIFVSPGPVYLLAAVFVLVNAGAKARHWLPGIHAARPESWGTVLLPLSLLPALAGTWSVGGDRIFILQIAFLTLALSDPLASWAGAVWGRREWIVGATVVGSGVFLTVTLVVTGVGLFTLAGWAPGRAVTGALVVAVAVTAVEAVGRRGWDNLFVVLGIILLLVPLHEAPDAEFATGLALTIGIAFGAGAYVARTLSKRGAVGGGLFAASLVGLGGWAWAVPGFVFFGFSSAISRWSGEDIKARREEMDTHEARSLRQVLANGSVAWVLLAVYTVLPSESGSVQSICYAGFLGALAAAAADTWATEIGVRFSSRPWSLRTGDRVPAGTSGAISLAGTVGAVLGAASVAGAAASVDGALGPVPWIRATGIVGAGLVGMAVDSLAGALVQACYRDPDTGRLVERSPAPDAVPIQGWAGVDNEVVNGLGTTAGALAAVLFW